MKKVFNYIYYHLYDLGVLIKNRQARESAILYLSIIVGLPLLPFVIGVLYKIVKRPPYFLSIIVALAYMFIVQRLVRKHFENNKKLNQIRLQFRHETFLQRRIGYITVIILLLSVFPLFLFLLPIAIK